MGKNGAWLAGLSGLYHVSVLGNNLLPLEGIALARGWWCMHRCISLCPIVMGPQGHSIPLPRAKLTCAAYKVPMCCPRSLKAAKHQQA
ncbi:hypothetical protein COCMIDRAFT_35642 [Bipolaris oryzae ATCC 44560]|uniref:Uncharacterized protein n=1 Tax=Bipolaris oryzae ATCC 44560 TaxID=930090 RepID=W6ZSX4_COCMI|nr:uncharacterized protein COCMIDRAFT_35642 [Bipolaris oryzae ATCC 44560]EUC46776.1 hypothetical protein COCMIDRAFT_35642 [Bipolaris oryzae ATCC 44560]